MFKIDFTDEEIEYAHAASLLGFDVIEKYEHLNPNNVKIRLCSENQSYNIKTDLFSQLRPGDKISLDYIIHSRELNRIINEMEKGD